MTGREKKINTLAKFVANKNYNKLVKLLIADVYSQKDKKIDIERIKFIILSIIKQTTKTESEASKPMRV
jgi:hypothetical protein